MDEAARGPATTALTLQSVILQALVYHRTMTPAKALEVVDKAVTAALQGAKDKTHMEMVQRPVRPVPGQSRVLQGQARRSSRRSLRGVMQRILPGRIPAPADFVAGQLSGLHRLEDARALRPALVGDIIDGPDGPFRGRDRRPRFLSVPSGELWA